MAATAARMSSDTRSGLLRRPGSPMVVYLRWARSPRPEPPLARRLGDAPVARLVPVPDAAPATRNPRAGLSRNARPVLPAGRRRGIVPPMRLPFEPPVEPMLAKASDGLPEGDGWLYEPKWDGFRALVFRDGDEVYIQSRDLKPLDRYFPELAEPLRAQLPERCVLDGEVVIAGDGRARLRVAAAADPPGRLAGADARRGDRRRRSSPGTCSRWATRTCGACPRASDARGSRSRSRTRQPPVHLTPATRDRAAGGGLVRPVRGRGPRRRRREAARRRRTCPGKRAMLKIKHERTADCVVAGFRWHKNGPGTHVGRLLLGPVRRRGRRSTTSGITSSFTWDKRAALVDGARAAPRGRARGPPVGRVGRVGVAGAADASGPAAAGRDEPLEPGQGPLVGAAPRRARRRGRLRPPAGRPVPSRDDVPPLAAGQGARGLPLRPAGDDRAIRARAHLRRRLTVVRRPPLPGAPP